MGFHVIVGAGAVGSGTALRLAGLGHQVRVVTRTGSGPDHGGVELVAADATDASLLTQLAQDADAIYNCANPPYHRWATAWPPLAKSFLTAAEASGARLVTMSNLYGYPAGSSPMRATDRLDPPSAKGRIRADMWHRALAANDEGRIRATEARASDYVGPGLGQTSQFGDRLVPRLLSGKSVSFIGDPSQPHSWTYIDDVCATLVTLGTDDRALGRAWHVPTLAPMPAAEMVAELCRVAGVDPVRVRRIPKLALRAGGMFVPMIGELIEMLYQFEAPFVIDSSDTTTTFGLTPTPLHDQLRATVAGYRTLVAA